MPPLRALVWAAVSSKVQATKDKASIPVQIARAEEFAAASNMIIVDHLLVPGHSRRYYTISEAAAAMRSKGITAFDQLLAHCAARDFDVLIFTDSSRLARKQGLTGEFVERIVDIGKRLYCLDESRFIDKNESAMWIAFHGFRSSMEIDQFMRRANMGKNKLAERGLPTGSSSNFAYIVERDEYGRAQRVLVDESKRNLFNDIYELFVLQRKSYSHLESELAARGHFDPRTNHEFGKRYFYNWLHAPTTWGHFARSTLRSTSRINGAMWGIDPSISPPSDVTMWYNTHPPVYTGEQAAAIIAELHRRRATEHFVRGKSTASVISHPLVGLLVCASCGCTLGRRHIKHGKDLIYFGCFQNNPSRFRKIRCPQPVNIRADKALAFVKDYVNQQVSRANAGQPLLQFVEPSADLAQLKQIDNEIGNLKRQASIITEKMISLEALTMMFDEKLQGINKRIRELNQQRVRIEHRIASADDSNRVELLRKLNIDEFWVQSPPVVNQTLHRIFGNLRLIIDHSKQIYWGEKL